MLESHLRFLLLGLAAAAGIVPPTGAAGLDGWVRSVDGSPVSAARVEAAGSSTVALSNALGRFRFEEVSLPVVLRVTHPSFATATLEVLDAEMPVEILLAREPDFEEDMLVAGSPLGDRYAPSSIASIAVDPQQRPVVPVSISEAVANMAGVSENGQGGLFQVVSLRGVSGQRVLSLISGARITSERRAGASTSFLDPQLVDEVDVLRGPASTYYGSGALGGVLQMEPRRFQRLHFEAAYSSQGHGHYQMLGWGGGRWSLGLSHRQAGDAQAADGAALHDGYDQWSSTFEGSLGNDRRSFNVVLLGSYGEDIAKSNTDFPQRTTTYPRERHLVARLATDTANWRAHAWVHPHDLRTEVVELAAARDRVDNETFDFGALWERQAGLGARTQGRFGVDYFGRRGVDVVESSVPLDGGLGVASLPVQSLSDGREDEGAMYGIVEVRLARARFETGLRGTWTRQSNAGQESAESSHLTGFIGAVVRLHARVELLANVGRGLRVPSLGELFFSGTTGRGRVLGNPNLNAESATNGELGLRFLGRRLLVRLAGFRNDIDDYIERIEIEPDLSSFRNLTSGAISGFELTGDADLTEHLRLSFGGHHIDGEDDEGAPLADIPVDKARLGMRLASGAWRSGAEVIWRRGKDRLGSGEKEISQALLVDASVAYVLRSGLELRLQGRNLLDELYFPSADRKAAWAPGRSLGVAVAWRGR